MKKILNFLFGGNSGVYCKWWNHEYEIKKTEFMVGTGNFIDGKEIEKKRGRYISTCRKCPKCHYGDSFPIF